MGNITGIENHLSDANTTYYFGNVDSFEYDNLHRLSSVTINGWIDGSSFADTYAYSYATNGNLTSKTNYVDGVGTEAIAISYSGHQAGTGTYSSNNVFVNIYDDNGNRERKRFYDINGKHTRTDKYLYNTENKMVQVLYSNSAESTWSRTSDAFYHLDGSRMWEGIMDEGDPGAVEGQMTFNPYVTLRLTSDGWSHLVGYVYGNGRRLMAVEYPVWNSSWGCQLSTWSKLKYITLPVIVANFGLLLTPLFLLILIRGLFFDKSWRGHRARNAFIVFFIVVFAFGLTPMPTSAGDSPSETSLWIWEHVKDRLARMYGSEEAIPKIANWARTGARLYAPKSGERSILRDSLFYFAPDKMRKEFESIWPRAAKLERDGERGTGDGGWFGKTAKCSHS